MSLLQISEPHSPTPKRVVGIDLGTTHSLLAWMQDGVGKVLADETGQVLVPSVVCYTPKGKAHIGTKAYAQQAHDAPHTIIASAKRLMGRSLTDIPNSIPYKLAQTPSGALAFETVAGLKTPVEVSAEILRALKQGAEQYLGESLAGAVVTVPAYFDDAQRQATKDAALLAGIPLLRLLNEPTAAALAYGLNHAQRGKFVVYDLGGGTFDISVLHLREGVFEVLAVNGNSALGGDDFDQCLLDMVQAELKLSVLTVQDRATLSWCVRQAKERLSALLETEISCDLSSGIHIRHPISRATLEKHTAHLVQKTLDPLRLALRDAKLNISDVDGVILVGGATRMPQVRQAVSEFFQQEPLSDIDPDQVVAIGAAIHAQALASEPSVLLLDVTPLSLGIETYGGLVERIIPRNSPLPVARAQEFTTQKDGQSAMKIHVVQGERERVDDCRSLAQFELRGIPPLPAGHAKVRVTFSVDADGLLTVNAEETSLGVQSQVIVTPANGLNADDIRRLLEDNFSHAEQDKQQRAVIEACLEAEDLIRAVQKALATDSHLLNAAEKANIAQSISAVQELVLAKDMLALRKAMEHLNHTTQGFAERRINAHLAQALQGKAIADFK